MRRFNVILSETMVTANKAGGGEPYNFEEVGASDVQIASNGALLFTIGDKVAIVYAPGSWLCFTEE